MKEKELNHELRDITSPYLQLSSVLEFLMSDPEVNTLLAKANDNMIGRLGFTDHGRVHAKIVSLNALRLLLMLKDKVEPSIIDERDGELEDSLIAVLVSAWLHDIGCSVTRKNHEVLGVVKAQSLINRVLKGVYASDERVAKIKTYIEEGILCHLGTYKSSTVEAGLVCIADGTDITRGRARLSYLLGGRDIHDFSAMSIESISFKKSRKGVVITVKMDNSAGIFQVEETLVKKLASTKLKDYFKIVVKIKGEKKKIEY